MNILYQSLTNFSISVRNNFSKIDLSRACLQLEIAPEHGKYLTFSTHTKWLYQSTRLMFAKASAPAIWQRFIEMVFQGIEGVSVYLYDILITGRFVETDWISKYSSINGGGLGKATLTDAEVKALLTDLKCGRWVDPKDRFGVGHTEFSLQKECIMQSIRMFIPKALRNTVLDELHSSHFGSSRMSFHKWKLSHFREFMLILLDHT